MDWEPTPENLIEDDRTFLDFYTWLLIPGAEEDDSPIDPHLAARLRLAVARVDRFRFRRLAVPRLRLFEEGLFRWFQTLEGESGDLVASLAEHRGWPLAAARNYLFAVAPPFVKGEVEVPVAVERYYGLAGVEFVHGHPEACVALCRAALEGVLKAHLGVRGGDTFSLGAAIDRLSRTRALAGAALKHASIVNAEANRVLHKLGEAREGSAEKAFGSLRAFIEGFFGHREGRRKRRGDGARGRRGEKVPET